MFDGNFRNGVDRTTGPIGKALASVGVTADLLTLSGILFAIGAGALIISGHLLLGFVAVLLSGLPDLLDGPVAKASGSSSRRGAFFDSFSDRISDLVVFGSLGWYYLDRHDHTMTLVAFGCYGFASFISYQRAKAESLGFNAKGGLFERAERVIAVEAGLLFSFALPLLLWVILVGSAVTSVQRFLKIWTQASIDVPQKSRTARRIEEARKARAARRTANRKRTVARPVGMSAGYRSQIRSRIVSNQSLLKRFRDSNGE